MVAWPMVEAVKHLRSRVQLRFSGPPAFAAFEKNQGKYHEAILGVIVGLARLQDLRCH